MSFASILSRGQHAMDAPLVRVEVDVSGGLPTFSIVGLPEAAVRESRDRVRAAITNCGFEFPSGRLTINLAPADVPKEGGRFDLPIAIGILAAAGRFPAEAFAEVELYGELSLNGDLCTIRGALATVLRAKTDAHDVILPHGNLPEAMLVRGVRLRGAKHLLDVYRHACGAAELPIAVARQPPPDTRLREDLIDVRGQFSARRALEIAAAGEHGMLMTGPPGSGKTMLARRLPGLLPPMSETEALEAAAIHSLTGRRYRLQDWRQRPLRSPHHTASAVALVGGGSQLRPGEISLAHHGVLFLDELAEFPRQVLEVLREPLESGSVCISRAARQAEFPAQFLFVAAMNPCPCGYLGHPSQRCRCPPERTASYRARVSGPLLDRIDLHVEVQSVTPVDLARAQAGEASAAVAARVAAARTRQIERQGCVNARLDTAALARYAGAMPEALQLLLRATQQLSLSARGHARALRVARTIADLEGVLQVETRHVAEAVALRAMATTCGR